MRSYVRWIGRLSLLGIVLALPACKGETDQGPKDRHSASGKVTYDGKPVPYGYVFFFKVESKPQQDGRMMAVASAPILDGKYEVQGLPIGMLKVCVAADPDVDLPELMQAYMSQSPFPMGADPKAGKDKGKDDGPKPPDWQEKDKKEDFKKNPKDKLSLKDKLDPKGKEIEQPITDPSKPPNPMTIKLTAEEKRMLREMHARYSELGHSTLSYVVHPGANTYDIEMERDQEKDKDKEP